MSKTFKDKKENKRYRCRCGQCEDNRQLSMYKGKNKAISSCKSLRDKDLWLVVGQLM